MKNIVNGLREKLETTNNSHIHKRLLKVYREQQGEIRCSYCPYHKHENLTADSWCRKSWKEHRQTQYRAAP